jgi:hypothetical protein
MSAAATAPNVINQPAPGRVGRLLNLVRKLIDYGKELATTLQQHGTTDLTTYTRGFGTRDIALILARITAGLLRAQALEARIVRNAARLDAAPKPKTRAAQRTPRAKPAAPPNNHNDSLAALPAAEQIAAEIRHRPIGAVIVDICCDLGITTEHPLWRELHLLIIKHGGNVVVLFKDLAQRLFAPLCDSMAPAPPLPPSPTPAGTGPP